MTREYDISIQPGHIARHTPKNAGAPGSHFWQSSIHKKSRLRAATLVIERSQSGFSRGFPTEGLAEESCIR